MTVRQWATRMPWLLVVVAVGLVAMGLTAIEQAARLGAGIGVVYRQLAWAALGLGAMLAVTLPSYRRMSRWAYWFFLLTLPLLVVVFLQPAIKGAHRWLRFGVVGLQPSEFAKLAFVCAVARYLVDARLDQAQWRDYRRLAGLVWPFLLAVVPMLLILKQPDLGTALLFLPVLGIMLFAAGARPRHLALVAVMGVVATPILWSVMSHEQRSRVTGLFHQRDLGERPRDGGYQLYQSKLAIGLGGLWGAGTIEPDDELNVHLPEAHNDFAFSLVAQRWGLVGAAGTLGLFVLLFTLGLRIAARTREPFGRLLVVGVAGLLGVQALINVAMTVGLAPVVGITLPFVSAGGSSMLASFLALGLLLNVAIRPGYEIVREPFRFAD